MKAKVRPLRRVLGGACTAYATADGRFEILKDPNVSAWPELRLHGYRHPRAAWLAYAAKGKHGAEVDTNLPVFVHGERAWCTLREACEALADGPIEIEGL
jgi:hypothetical protein